MIMVLSETKIKSGVDELRAVFDAIPEDYIGFVSIFESFPY